jgi:hypothetical protein
MFIDNYLLFDPAGTAITVSAPSANVLDMLNARDMGIGADDGPELNVFVNIQQTFTAAGAATLNVQLQSSTDNATWQTIAQTGALAKAGLTANSYIAKFPLPPSDQVTPEGGGPILPRYYRLNYVVATGPFTGGTVESWLGASRQTAIPYPPGVTIAN